MFVSSFFAYSSIVLEKDTIEHNDYTFTEAIYNNTNQDPGDALPPEACHIRGELGRPFRWSGSAAWLT